jgi:hypothetical protein
MSATLEIPFSPPRPPGPESRLEPPQVAFQPRWEYKEIVRDAGGELLSEAELDALGAQHWELAGIAPAGIRVHFYFKRERGL